MRLYDFGAGFEVTNGSYAQHHKIEQAQRAAACIRHDTGIEDVVSGLISIAPRKEIILPDGIDYLLILKGWSDDRLERCIRIAMRNPKRLGKVFMDIIDDFTEHNIPFGELFTPSPEVLNHLQQETGRKARVRESRKKAYHMKNLYTKNVYKEEIKTPKGYLLEVASADIFQQIAPRKGAYLLNGIFEVPPELEAPVNHQEVDLAVAMQKKRFLDVLETIAEGPDSIIVKNK